MNKTGITYRSLIEGAFTARRQRNPGYSLRAFARDLSMPPSKLSEVMRGICGLSRTSAQKIAGKLLLSAPDTEWFIESVEAKHSRSKRVRKEAESRLQVLSETQGFDELNLERFKIIADWHHFALLELTEVANFSSDPQWIAARLDIDVGEVKQAILRLLDFGLLQKNAEGELSQTNTNLATPSGIPSREIRKHHRQILAKADESLDKVAVEEREISASTMSFAVADLAEARTLLKTFRRQFNETLSQRASVKDRVYCLSIQLFPLDKGTL